MKHLAFPSLAMFVTPAVALGQVPMTVNFAAVVTDQQGTPVSGANDILIVTFDAATAGNSLGTLFADNVALDDEGSFTVRLSFNGVDISGGELYVELWVNDDVISPRFPVHSVPYALRAGACEEPLPEDSVLSSHIANGAVGTEEVAAGFGLVPAGTIVIWSGSIGSIPAGWVLCDGTNGTPDLSDRFVMGTTTDLIPADRIGGSAAHALSVGELPIHAHDFATDADGVHEHQLPWEITGMNNTSPTEFDFGMVPSGSGHLEAMDATASAGHSHSGTTQTVGSGETFSTLPPYYKLAYIMLLP